MQKYIHKKTGKLYRLLTDNLMIKEEYKGWKGGLVLYKALYPNPDAKFFARTPEDFFSNFEKAGEDETEN